MAPQTPHTEQSFTEMKGDVEAIGKHCQMEYCNVLDFLPFECDNCGGIFCLDHRTVTAHKCPKEGEWARKRADRDTSNEGLKPSSKPTLYDHDRQCSEPSCKTLIYTSLTPGVHCMRCNWDYCLKHRMEEDHDCKNTEPKDARKKNILQIQQERGLSALAKMRVWAEKQRLDKEKALKKKTKHSLFGLGGKSSSAAAAASAHQAEINELKKAAKGDANIPREKRVYLRVEASADTTKAKYPTGKFFYHKDWSVGRVLDMAAKSLQVQNINNRSEKEEDKLRVFHVEGGRLLKFSEKIGEPCVNGHMIVLLRGVGSGEPDLIDS